jgi:hypothetical protein
MGGRDSMYGNIAERDGPAGIKIVDILELTKAVIFFGPFKGLGGNIEGNTVSPLVYSCMTNVVTMVM